MGSEVRRNLRKTLSKFHSITLDTNIFVYYFDRNSSFYSQAEKLFEQIAVRNLSIFTSVITLSELLSFKASRSQIYKLEQELLLIPNLTMIDVNREIAKEAARIRREYKFRLPDSIQLATALIGKAQAFVTNDQRLKKFQQLPIVLLSLQ